MDSPGFLCSTWKLSPVSASLCFALSQKLKGHDWAWARQWRPSCQGEECFNPSPDHIPFKKLACSPPPLFFIFFITMVISLAQTLNSSHLVSHHERVLICLFMLPSWLSGKESTCQCRRCMFDPWIRKIPWRRKWQPTPVFLPGKSYGQRSLAGCSPWSHKETRHSDWACTYFYPPGSLLQPVLQLLLY